MSRIFSSNVFRTGVGCRRWGILRSKVFSSDVGDLKSEGFSSEVETRRWEVGKQRSEVGGRTRERDGGLQPPIERLVYIYIYIYREREGCALMWASGGEAAHAQLSLSLYIYIYMYIYIYIYICSQLGGPGNGWERLKMSKNSFQKVVFLSVHGVRKK